MYTKENLTAICVGKNNGSQTWDAVMITEKWVLYFLSARLWPCGDKICKDYRQAFDVLNFYQQI